MSAPRPTAATTTRPSPTGGAGPAPGGNGGGGILVPGGPGTGGPSPSPSPISTVLIGDTRGWVCDSTGTCGKGISATTIAALTVIGAIALLAIAGTMVWVRMRTKRDVNVGMAQKERRDRYTRRGSRARSRSRGQNTLQRIINKQNGSEHELRSVNVDNQQQQDPFGYMKQTAAPEQFIAPPPQGQVNPMKPPVGFAPQPQPFAQPVVMMGGPAPPGYSMAPPQGQMPPPPQQQFGPPPGGMYMQGPPPPQQQFRQ